MSLIIPKTQILYAPMLGSLGGGSVRGFGRGVGSVDYGYFGPEYDGWAGDRIDINFSNGTVDDDASTNFSWSGLDGFLSSELGYFYSGYSRPQSFVHTRAGVSYTGLPNFYSTGTVDNIHGSTSDHGDRGVTVGYTADKSPVLITGSSSVNATGNIAAFTRDNSRSGKFTFLRTGTLDITTDLTALDWDGTYLLAFSRTTQSIRAYTLPSDTAQSFDLTYTYEWNISTGDLGDGYGGAYLGQDADGYRYVVSQDGNRDVFRWRLDPIGSGTLNATNLGIIVATSTDPVYGQYTLAVDHLNRTLLQGAHNIDGRFSVWQE
jgi:hypothetical protein